MNTYKVTEELVGLRVDKLLSQFLPEKSRTFISKVIDEGNCQVNGKVSKGSYKVRVGDEISLDIPEEKPLEVNKEDIPLDVVYEDSDILVINKPQGMVVHPSFGHWSGTLVNAVLNHCDDLSGINGVIRPGIVHRIDKDTSGLICVAKNDFAHHELAEQLKDHTMAREYLCLVKGIIKENKGTINLPIGRDKGNRQKMAVNAENGKPAITHFTVVKRFTNHTLVDCQLVTGRTHQIRVHMAYINHPVEGDPLYCKKNAAKLHKEGQLLTAYKLKLIHPRTKKEMTFQIDIPDYFKKIIKELK